MKTKALSIVPAFVFAAALAYSLPEPLVAGPDRKAETIDGVRVVHNTGRGAWGKIPQVTLEPVRVLGDVDAVDGNVAFFLPSTIAVDAAGNLYVLDSGNHRVQKFDAAGNYLASFGRQGQGPGELYFPAWLAVDGQGFLYVTDANNQRLQVLGPDGKEHKTVKFLETAVGSVFLGRPGELVMVKSRLRFMMNEEQRKAGVLPKLVNVLDADGKPVREFGEPRDFGDDLVNTAANEAAAAVGDDGQVYLAFLNQNRIDKYAADGRLLWRADRELPYDMGIKEKGKIERTGSAVSVRMPQLNRCASGVAVDAKGRVWVVTLSRQLAKEERAGTAITMTQGESGGRMMGYKAEGNTELRTTDAYRLEVFDSEGVLLGSLPLDCFVDGIFISGDRLFLLDKLRGTQFREFRIKG